MQWRGELEVCAEVYVVVGVLSKLRSILIEAANMRGFISPALFLAGGTLIGSRVER